jgi:LacI family transcriptional regulator
MPVVVLDRRIAGRNVDSVRCDSEAGAHALARHLIELGHRRIAVLTGRRTVSTSVDRVAGCRRALEEAGLTLPDELVHWGGFNFGKLNQADGHRMATEVLAADGERPTAVFCANNFIGFGAIRALRDSGLRVPDDMSVVAFDDLPSEWVSEPFLTVAAQPAYDIGHHGASLLLDHIAGRLEQGGQSVVLPFELIIRRSSGPPPVAQRSVQGVLAVAPRASRRAVSPVTTSSSAPRP